LYVQCQYDVDVGVKCSFYLAVTIQLITELTPSLIGKFYSPQLSFQLIIKLARKLLTIITLLEYKLLSNMRFRTVRTKRAAIPASTGQASRDSETIEPINALLASGLVNLQGRRSAEH
jgi:hypothetical protein